MKSFCGCHARGNWLSGSDCRKRYVWTAHFQQGNHSSFRLRTVIAAYTSRILRFAYLSNRLAHTSRRRWMPRCRTSPQRHPSHLRWRPLRFPTGSTTSCPGATLRSQNAPTPIAARMKPCDISFRDFCLCSRQQLFQTEYPHCIHGAAAHSVIPTSVTLQQPF